MSTDDDPAKPAKRREFYRVDPAAMAHRDPPPPRVARTGRHGRGTAGGLGAVAVITLAVLRGFGTMTSHAPVSYDYSHITNIDPHLFDHLDTTPPPDLSGLLKAPDMPIPIDASETQPERVARIVSSLETLQVAPAVTIAQSLDAAAFQRLVATGDCKRIVAGLPKLTPDSPPAPLPSVVVQAHLAAVRERVDAWCGKTVATPTSAKPPSVPRK